MYPDDGVKVDHLKGIKICTSEVIVNSPRSNELKAKTDII